MSRIWVMDRPAALRGFSGPADRRQPPAGKPGRCAFQPRFIPKFGINCHIEKLQLADLSKIAKSVASAMRLRGMGDGFWPESRRKPVIGEGRNCLAKIAIAAGGALPEQNGLRKLYCVKRYLYQ